MGTDLKVDPYPEQSLLPSAGPYDHYVVIHVRISSKIKEKWWANGQ